MAKKEYIRIQSLVSLKIMARLKKLAKKNELSMSRQVFTILVSFFERLDNDAA